MTRIKPWKVHEYTVRLSQIAGPFSAVLHTVSSSNSQKVSAREASPGGTELELLHTNDVLYDLGTLPILCCVSLLISQPLCTRMNLATALQTKNGVRFLRFGKVNVQEFEKQWCLHWERGERPADIYK